jgi:hypothetical protein
MVQKSGTFVPSERAELRRKYITGISSALQEELGNSARAAKTIMQWTGSSERAAKYWLAGARAPNGPQLLMLARNSDKVMRAFVRLAGREDLELAVRLTAVEASLAQAISIVQSVKHQ